LLLFDLSSLPCVSKAASFASKINQKIHAERVSQFSAACFFQGKENHEDNTLCIIKGFSAALGKAGS